MKKLLSLLLVAGLAATLDAASGPKTIKLFNGRDLDGWYTYTAQTQYENPGIFTVVDGMLRVSGGAGDTAYYGGIITKQAFANYRLTFDYKWGGPTYGNRKGKSRDSGVLLHCIGPNEKSPWMTSYEYQIIEGGTGDILVVNATKKDDAGNPATLLLTSEGVIDGRQKYYKKGGETISYKDGGRHNWWGRDPKWTDTMGVRGPQDVESPYGQWTRCEIVCRGDTLEFYVNGKLVNRAWGLNITKGKILFQTEGAEVWFRNIELTQLD
jgi:hypothetical protein